MQWALLLKIRIYFSISKHKTKTKERVKKSEFRKIHCVKRYFCTNFKILKLYY